MARHHLHTGTLAAAGIALCALSGCGVTELGGRLDLDNGNQSVGAGVIGGSAVEADTVELRTIRGELVASAEVAADGRFSFGDIEPMAAPYLIETRANGALTGRALGALDLFSGQRTLIGPVSEETSAEAEAFLRLASEHGAEAVDPIGVILNISSELAATADLETMSEAAWQAQVAWQAAVEARAGFEVTADELREGRSLAFAELIATLDGAIDAEEEREAWAQFHARARATLRSALNLDTETQATAAAAAALSLASTYDGEEGGRFALALAAELAARVSQEAVAEDAEAEAEADGESRSAARARVEAAFALFFDAVAQSRAEEDIEQARLDLEAALTGEGDSLLAGMLDGEGEGGLLDGLLDLMADLTVALGIDVEAFSEAESGEDAGRAALDLRIAVDAEVDGSLRGEASDEASDFAAEAQFALSVQAALGLSIDAGGEGGENDRVVSGVVLDGVLGLQLGASGLVDGDASIEGDSVAVIRVDGDGSVTVIGEGALDGVISLNIDGREFESDGEEARMYVLEVLAAGEVVGAVILDGRSIEEGGDIDSAPITLESTVEALIALELAGEGHAVDLASLDAMIDGAIAGTEEGTAHGIEVLAEAALAAQTAFAAGLNTTAEEMNRITAEARANLSAALSASAESAEEAREEFRGEVDAAIEASLGVSAHAVSEARLHAAAAFVAVVEAQSMAMDEASQAAASARGSFDAAVAVAAQLRGTLEGEARGQLDAALSAMVEAMAEAQSSADVEGAQDDFRAALVGEGQGSVLATLTAGAGLLEQGAIDQAAEAMNRAEARLRAQLAAAGELAGQADGALAGQAVSQAYAEFAVEADAAVAGLLVFDGLSGVDGEAVAQVLVSASAGVFGELDAR